MDVLGLLSSLVPGLLAVLVVSIPLFFKRAVESFAEKAVGSVFDKRLAKYKAELSSVFEKQLEKYKAELSRATMAREVMLEREMAFYDTIDEQIAEVVPLIQDARDGLTERPFTETKRGCLVRIPELVIEMKDVALRYEAYVSADIWAAFNVLVVELQSQCDRWLDFAKKISSENEVGFEDKDAAGRMCDKVLSLVALVRTRQANYLKSISGEKR